MCCRFQRDESDFVPPPEQLASQADALYKAGPAKWGCDEAVFTTILANINEKHCAALQEKYMESTPNKKGSVKRTLWEDVKSAMSKNLEYAVLTRLMTKWEFLSRRIYKACKGFGTDEETICRILATIPKEEIVAQLVPTFDALYGPGGRWLKKGEKGHDFLELMRRENSGDFLQAIRDRVTGIPPCGHNHLRLEYEPVIQAYRNVALQGISATYDGNTAAQLGSNLPGLDQIYDAAPPGYVVLPCPVHAGTTVAYGYGVPRGCQPLPDFETANDAFAMVSELPQVAQFTVQVPPGVVPGQQIAVTSPSTGQQLIVTIPPGIPPGGTFQVQG